MLAPSKKRLLHEIKRDRPHFRRAHARPDFAIWQDPSAAPGRSRQDCARNGQPIRQIPDVTPGVVGQKRFWKPGMLLNGLKANERTVVTTEDIKLLV